MKAEMYTANFPRFTVVVQDLPFDSSNDWLISISDRDAAGADIPEGKFERVHRSFFWDVSEDKPERPAINEEQALLIAGFIKLGMSQGKNILVNCHAGISRSGAVVALLMDLGYEFKDTGLSPRRLPNALVYRRIADHFEELQQSWSDKFMKRK